MGAKMIVLIMVAVISMICLIPITYAQSSETAGTASTITPPGDILTPCVPSTTFGPTATYFATVNFNVWNGGGACGQTYNLTCTSSPDPTAPCTFDSLEVEVNKGCTSTACLDDFILTTEEISVIAGPTDAPINIQYIQTTPS